MASVCNFATQNFFKGCVAGLRSVAVRRSASLVWRSLASAAGSNHSYDVAVVGGGPGGYVAAIKAAQLGLKTVCVEKRGSLGGTCLNVGCIPSKALLNISHKYYEMRTMFPKMGIVVPSQPSIDLEKMFSQKDKTVKGLCQGIEYLFKKNGVEYRKGTASVGGPNLVNVSPNDGSATMSISAKHIILATGSEPSPFPGGSIKADEKIVVTSTGALSLEKIPKKMVVIGGGVIGLELGSVWSRLGAEVEVVEFLDRVAPALDAEIGKSFQKLLEKQGLRFSLSTKVTGADVHANGATVHLESASGARRSVQCDTVLLSVGRRPVTSGLGLEALGIVRDKLGRVEVDDVFRVKSVPTVFAIGDIIKGPMLAHKAEEEGVAVANFISSGVNTHVDYNTIPNVVYTHPEVAGVGKTEEELKGLSLKYNRTVFPFAANSRARANDDSDGMVKILSDPSSRKILGAWILGPNAGELIQELVFAMQRGATVAEIGGTCHAHPTLSEAVKEACMGAYSKPIHLA